jgi:hypothetical protein
MLVIRACSTSIRSGLLEKGGVITLRYGAQLSSVPPIHPLPLLVGVNPHQKHPSLPQKDGVFIRQAYLDLIWLALTQLKRGFA